MCSSCATVTSAPGAARPVASRVALWHRQDGQQVTCQRAVAWPSGTVLGRGHHDLEGSSQMPEASLQKTVPKALCGVAPVRQTGLHAGKSPGWSPVLACYVVAETRGRWRPIALQAEQSGWSTVHVSTT